MYYNQHYRPLFNECFNILDMTRCCPLEISGRVLHAKQRSKISFCNLSQTCFHLLEVSGVSQGVKLSSSEHYPFKLEHKHLKMGISQAVSLLHLTYLPSGMAWRTAELSLSAPLSLCKSRWLYPNRPLGMVSDIICRVIVVLSTSQRWSQLALVRDYLLRHSTQHLEKLIF